MEKPKSSTTSVNKEDIVGVEGDDEDAAASNNVEGISGFHEDEIKVTENIDTKNDWDTNYVLTDDKYLEQVRQIVKLFLTGDEEVNIADEIKEAVLTEAGGGGGGDEGGDKIIGEIVSKFIFIFITLTHCINSFLIHVPP